jgi:ribonucleoside-diphosphate reductase alpha chain
MTEADVTSSTDSEGSTPARNRAKARKNAGLRVERVYTTAGTHPYDEVTWERRDVVMTNWRDGSINFEQRGVEFPEFWSVNATNIVTSKYFRGAVGSDKREKSLRQLVDRVVGVYTNTGIEHGYFASPEDAEIFDHELKHALTCCFCAVPTLNQTGELKLKIWCMSA